MALDGFTPSSAASRSSEIGLRKFIGQALLNWGLLIFLIALVIIFSLLEHRFATLTNLKNVIRQAAPLALLASGQAVVLIAGGVDVSVGAIIALSSVCMVAMVWNAGVIAGIVSAILVGGLIGAINGSIIAFWRVNAFVVTLAMMTTIRGVALYVTGGIPMYGNIPDSMLFLGNGDIGPVPVAVFVSALGFAVLYYFLRLTPAGRQIYALGGNKEAARLAGINVVKITILAFVISGLFAGAAGAVLTSRGGIGAPEYGRWSGARCDRCRRDRRCRIRRRRGWSDGYNPRRTYIVDHQERTQPIQRIVFCAAHGNWFDHCCSNCRR